jgi:hypothetical protein
MPVVPPLPPLLLVLQVAQLQKQYEEIAALAAAAGLQLEDPLSGSPPPKKQQGAAAAAAPAVDAPAKGPQPKAIEVAEGDRKVRGWSLHCCLDPFIVLHMYYMCISQTRNLTETVQWLLYCPFRALNVVLADPVASCGRCSLQAPFVKGCI